MGWVQQMHRKAIRVIITAIKNPDMCNHELPHPYIPNFIGRVITTMNKISCNNCKDYYFIGVGEQLSLTYGVGGLIGSQNHVAKLMWW